MPHTQFGQCPKSNCYDFRVTLQTGQVVSVSKVVVVAADIFRTCSELISEAYQPSKRIAVAELEKDYTVRVTASSVCLKQVNQAGKLALKGFTHEGILRIALKKQQKQEDQRNQTLIRQIVKQRRLESSRGQVRSCNMLSQADKIQQFTNALTSQVCSSLYLLRELPFFDPNGPTKPEVNLLEPNSNKIQEKTENNIKEETQLVQPNKQKGQEPTPPRSIAPHVEVFNPFLQNKTLDFQKIIKGEHRRGDTQDTVSKQVQQKTHERNPAFDNPFSRGLQKQIGTSPFNVVIQGGNEQSESKRAIPPMEFHATGFPSLAGNVFICSKPSGGLFEDEYPKRMERKTGRKRKQEARVQ